MNMREMVKHSGNCDRKSKETVKYGELVILGYNGSLPSGDRKRRKSKFEFRRRTTANGIKRLKQYAVESLQTAKAFKDPLQYTISYALSKDESIIAEYVPDEDTDMFQIGRSSESPIDFVVMDTVPGEKLADGQMQKSTVSRFACRILCDRADPSVVRIFAAGFDSLRNIFLGEKAIKWQEDDKIDALTTNGVLLLHPTGAFIDGEVKPGLWKEVSIGGDVFSLREFRSAPTKGMAVTDEANVLKDGTLIDLCGVTLLWRSAEGLLKSPTKKRLETLVERLNSGRFKHPGVINPVVVIPRTLSEKLRDEDKKPYVYLACGHVLHHEESQCPTCSVKGKVVTLCMGMEPAFYIDEGAPTYAFNPCGHMATEKTVKYWANIGVPHGTNGFEAICPFCATPIVDYPGYVRLIFQDL